jgi:O-antigen/teichoic acid export membrane protein
LGMLGLGLVVTCISNVLIKFMTNERYHNASEIIIWIAMANAVNAMYSVLVPYSVHTNKTKVLAGIMFVAAIVNLIGNYFLVPINGAVGSAQATLLAFCTSFLLNWMLVNKTYPMPWFDKRILIAKGNSIE